MSAEIYRIICQERLSITEVASCTGLQVQEVMEYFQRGLIEPVGEDRFPVFSDSAVLRINKILRLQSDLGVSMDSMELVLDLLDRIEQLEAELHWSR